MQRILAHADAAPLPPVMLIGDQSYYQQFGFENALSHTWQMPGLAAPKRILLRGGAGLPNEGAVEAAALPAFAPPRKQQAAA